MERGTFSNQLKILMKKRGISQQKIADAVNLSQKTISRYYTGEICPDKEVQQKILRAIADISGHSKDVELFEPVKPLPKALRGLPPERRMSDEELEEMEYQDWCMDKLLAGKVFSLLEESNQRFAIKHFSEYCSVDIYEIAIVEMFSIIPEKKREFILDNLSVVRMDYKAMDCFTAWQKVTNYRKLISDCKGLELEEYKKFQNLPDEVEETELMKEYADKLEHVSGMNVEKMRIYLPELINFDQRDFYLLILVQMLGMSDQGLNASGYGTYVGDKEYALIEYLEKLVKQEEM